MALIDLHMLTAAARGAVTPGNVPVGTVIAYMGIDVPDQWLPCDGQAVSRTTYAELFAVLGVVHGEGDGVETFNLPNLNNGSFLEGGATAGTMKDPGLPNITGSFWARGNANPTSGVVTQTAADSQGGYPGNMYADYLLTFNINASLVSSIYGASTTVQPKATTVRWLIRAQHGGEGSGMINARDEMHESGVYTAPVTGWYTIVVKGGGGGGAASSTTSSHALSGYSGGEGGTTFAYEYMTTGDTAEVTIGAGGPGGTGKQEAVGTSGGDSSVNVNGNTYIGGGGDGGNRRSLCGGGVGTIPGCPGSPEIEAPYGGVPSTPGGGNGGAKIIPAYNPGQDGINGGGGGGASSVYNGNYWGAGGDGGDGYVWFLYHDPRKT